VVSSTNKTDCHDIAEIVLKSSSTNKTDRHDITEILLKPPNNKTDRHDITEILLKVGSTNKTDHHDITEILLEVALKTINQTKPSQKHNTSIFYISYYIYSDISEFAQDIFYAVTH